MTGNVKNWKSFNENAINHKDFDNALAELTKERNIQYLKYITQRFENVGLSFRFDELEYSLNGINAYVNDIPMRFSNTGSTLYFKTDNKNFPKRFLNTNLVGKGYRSAEALKFALNKELGLHKTANVNGLIKTGLLD